MAIAGVHLSVMMLTAYQNNLNFKLTQITERRQLIATQESAIIQEYASNTAQASNASYDAAAAAVTTAVSTGDTTNLQSAVDTMMAASKSNSSISFTNDPDIMLLQLQDNDFDMQQKKLETQLKAVTANLESQEKLQDNNIKEDFGSNMSIN